MLNEAYNLLQALRAADIELPSYQQGVVTPGRNTGPCLRVRLQQDSSISSIEALTDEEWSGLWTIMDGNQNSRPVFRLNVPLLQIPLEDSWWNSIGYTINQKRENISDVDRLNALKVALGRSDWFQSFAKSSEAKNNKEKSAAEKVSDLWFRVREKAKEISSSLHGSSDLADVQSLFERIGNLPDMQDFAVLLRSVIKAQMESGKLPIDPVETLLVGKLKRKEEKWECAESKVQLAFDIDNCSTIYLTRTRKAIEAVLGGQREGSIEERPATESIAECAYGSAAPLQNSAFPNPQLPIVGEKGMPLVSMFREAPANTRYRFTDSAIVPVGQMLASEMAKALIWVTSEEREGKTWCGLASGIFNKSREQRDLFIAYIDGKPQIDVDIADFFGKDQDSSDKQFEVDSKIVCDALKSITRDRPSSKLRLFALRQVSPGQVQVVLSRTLDPMQIITGAKFWNDGAKNLPPITVPLPKEKNKAPEDGCPVALYPNQVVRLLSRQWIREGAKKNKQEPFAPVTGPTLGSVIDLLIREPGKYESIARDLLRRTLIQVGPLLKGLVGAMRKGKKEHDEQYPAQKQYPEKNRYQALNACSTIGLALYALNSRKEDYMQNSAFAVGKMLALADDIHRSYCVVVRNDSIPPSLLGNSLLSTALENPSRAVAALGDRLKVYIGWAKTAKEPQSSDKDLEKKQIAIRTARNRLVQYGLLAESIADQGLPTKMDNEAKAHLMLGYLASTKDNNE
jgi:hypothetical protein